MKIWKRNLFVLCMAQAFVMAAMSLMLPFLPLYLKLELGVTNPGEIQLWTGLIFGVNFLSMVIVSPLWGRLADRIGRKVMLLRSGVGMGIVMILMGVVASPWQLFALRLLNGTISGFHNSAISLVSINTPKEKISFAIGILQSGSLIGSILGPALGGLLADWIGYRCIFFVVGTFFFIATLLVGCFVQEVNKPVSSHLDTSMKEDFKKIFHIPSLPSLFATGFLVQFALFSTNPFLTLFVQDLKTGGDSLSFYSGLAVTVTGVATMIFAPFLGRWGDKIGSEKILSYCLIGAVVALVPHVFVVSYGQLLACRFLLGISIAGLLPSIHSLIRHLAPEGMESRAYGFSNSFIFLGNLIGPISGGLLGGWIGIRGLFLLAAFLFLVNVVWNKVQMHKKEGNYVCGNPCEGGRLN